MRSKQINLCSCAELAAISHILHHAQTLADPVLDFWRTVIIIDTEAAKVDELRCAVHTVVLQSLL